MWVPSGCALPPLASVSSSGLCMPYLFMMVAFFGEVFGYSANTAWGRYSEVFLDGEYFEVGYLVHT